MDIALVRIDNRLVHGQILEAWLPHTKAAVIVVVDDDVANDFFRETVIRMAVPRGVDVRIASVDEFSTAVPSPQDKGLKTLVLFANCYNALRAYRGGFRFAKLNVGNVYDEACLRQFSSCVYVGKKELECLKTLLYEGVRVELQRLPKDEPMDVGKLLGVCEG